MSELIKVRINVSFLWGDEAFKADRTFYALQLMECEGFSRSSSHNGPARLLLWHNMPGCALLNKADKFWGQNNTVGKPDWWHHILQMLAKEEIKYGKAVEKMRKPVDS